MRKIIKGKRQIKKEQRKHLKAIQGCDYCPNCGEREEINVLSASNHIANGWYSVWTYQYHYECRKCGALWESGKWKEITL